MCPKKKKLFYVKFKLIMYVFGGGLTNLVVVCICGCFCLRVCVCECECVSVHP